MSIISIYVSKGINNLIKIDKEDNVYEVLNEGSKLFNCYIFFKGTDENYAGKYVDKDILEKGLEIDLDIKTTNIILFKEDFKIILSNPIGNAVNHTTGGEIKLIAKEDSIAICNKIESREIFKKDIFAAFNSLNIIKSSGLGLYVCKEICIRNKWDLNYILKENEIIFNIVFK
ncbi:MAG: hypothetical protein ACRDD2_12185 [Sarcina sp.]